MFTMNHTSAQALRAALGVTRNIGLPAVRTGTTTSRLRHRFLIICRWVPIFRGMGRQSNPCCNN